MAWEVALRCDRCRRAYQLRTGDFRFYLVTWQPADLPACERVACSDAEGWCHRCRRPRAIESVPHAEAITDPARLRWRRERVSSPRCLCCGSAAVELLGPDFRHPGCGGVLEVAGTPWHLQPSVAYLLPAEGPPERGWPWVAWSRLTG